MAGVFWDSTFEEYDKMKSEITKLFSLRGAIPDVGLQYYRFSDYHPIYKEWVINRHFFFPKIMELTDINYSIIKTYNGKISLEDWVKNPNKYDLFVLEIIQPILESYGIKRVEFCGLHEYNITYGYSKDFKRWVQINKRSI